jgi:phage replication O-like protein O
MTLFRDLTKASLDADLNKNEAKVFSALVHQTIGFSKASDNLTDKRLAHLTGMRIDRLRLAIDGVIAKGLFEVEPSRHYDYHYSIAEKFLNDDNAFFAPHIPKKGIDFSKKEEVSEIKNVLPKNRDIHTITFTSFNPTYSNPQQQSLVQVVSERPVDEIVSEQAIEEMVVQQPIEEMVIQQPVEQLVENLAPKKDVVVVDLPKNIEAQHHAACSAALMGLSGEQRQRVLITLEIKQKTEVVYNSVGLLIALAKAEGEGRLIVPKRTLNGSLNGTANGAPKGANTATAYRPASHQLFDSPEHPDNKNTDKIKLNEHIGKLNWLRENAGGKPMIPFAKLMGLEACVADTALVQRWLASRAKFEGKSVQALAEVLGLGKLFHTGSLESLKQE